MADPSIWNSVAPIFITTFLVSTWMGTRQRSAFTKEMKRLLAENFPAVEGVLLDLQKLSFRCRGRLYNLPVVPLYKAFERKKATLPDLLQNALIQATGLTPQELAEKPAAPALNLDTLQFEKTDVGVTSALPARCGICSTPLSQEYFEVNGEAACASCKEAVSDRLLKGSDWQHVPRALLYGSGAAAVGCVIYYAIRSISGYEFGLVAVVVGLLVGNSVKKASRGRGGAIYQTIAVSLTYAAITFTYAPYILQAILTKKTLPKPAAVDKHTDIIVSVTGKEAGTSSLKEPPSLRSSPASPPAGPATPPRENKTAIQTTATPTPPTPAFPTATRKKTWADGLLGLPKGLQVFVGLLAILFLILATPFLVGVKNLMGLLILSFALYEAWKLNKRPAMQIKGPFQLGRPPSSE